MPVRGIQLLVKQRILLLFLLVVFITLYNIPAVSFTSIFICIFQRSSSLRVPLSKSPEPPAITNTQQQLPQQQQQQQRPHPKVSQRNSRTRGSQVSTNVGLSFHEIRVFNITKKYSFPTPTRHSEVRHSLIDS